MYLIYLSLKLRKYFFSFSAWTVEYMALCYQRRFDDCVIFYMSLRHFHLSLLCVLWLPRYFYAGNCHKYTEMLQFRYFLHAIASSILAVLHVEGFHKILFSQRLFPVTNVEPDHVYILIFFVMCCGPHDSNFWVYICPMFLLMPYPLSIDQCYIHYETIVIENIMSGLSSQINLFFEWELKDIFGLLYFRYSNCSRCLFKALASKIHVFCVLFHLIFSFTSTLFAPDTSCWASLLRFLITPDWNVFLFLFSQMRVILNISPSENLFLLSFRA